MPADSNSVLIFDVETTGTAPDQDQIIELCVQYSMTDADTARTWRFKPDVPIQAAAQAVHGISAEDLKDCPAFAEKAEEVAAAFTEAEIIVGYNVRFDLSFLLSEFQRADYPAPDMSEKIVIDPFQLWRHFEPRTLSGAHKRFVGTDFDGAHSASADVAATGLVLEGMLREFKLESEDWPEVSKRCPINEERKGWIGPSNHFVWENEIAVFGFGKHRGRSIESVAKSDGGSYVDWMAKKDFPKHVMEIAQEARKRVEQDFHLWLKGKFPA